MSQPFTIPTWFLQGGPFMYAILGVGVVALAIAAERFWVLRLATAWNPRKFSGEVVRLAQAHDLPGAIRFCEQARTPLGAVGRSLLAAAQIPGDVDQRMERMRNAADEAAILSLPPLARRLPHLNLLANTATLLGLLGTIFGLTTAFSSVGAADPSQRSAFLAAGISEALNTTAFGLIIAVPTLLLHGYLASRIEGIVAEVDQLTVRLSRLLAQPRAQETGARRTA
jgi:biopolymer transport protein ExbB